MRYTRYNTRKNKTNRVIPIITTFIMIILIAVLIGGMIYKIILPTNMGNDIPTNADINGDSVADSKEVYEFIFVQCGLFSKKENANNIYNKVKSGYNAFIVEENNEFRVSAGIYVKEEAQKVREELKGKEIETSEIMFAINNSDDSKRQIALMVDGLLKVTNILRDSEVESVKTESLKEWVKNEFTEVSDGEDVEECKKIRNIIEKIPETLNKESAEEVLKEVFIILEKYKNSK